MGVGDEREAGKLVWLCTDWMYIVFIYKSQSENKLAGSDESSVLCKYCICTFTK